METHWTVERTGEEVWLVLHIEIRARAWNLRRRILSTGDEWTEIDLRQMSVALNERNQFATNHVATLQHMSTLHEFLGVSLKYAKTTSLLQEKEKRDLEAWKAIHAPFFPRAVRTISDDA